MSISEELRKRIMVVAIAPAAYIDEDICLSIYHYVSRKDFIPFLDFKGYFHNKDSIIKINPSRNTTFFDHNFNSPTYNKFISDELNEFINKEVK